MTFATIMEFHQTFKVNTYVVVYELLITYLCIIASCLEIQVGDRPKTISG